MKFVVPREGANAPQTRSFLKLYWFSCLLLLFAAPLTDAMANSGPSVSPVAAMTIKKENGAVTKSPSGIFSDPDGDTLSYSVQSSNTSVVTGGVSYKTINFFGAKILVPDKIVITPVAAGKGKITITGTDPHGRWARVAFSVTVTENKAPTGSLSDMTLTVAGGAKTVNLSSSISDADGDALTFSVSSSNTSYVTVSVSGSTLTITPVVKGGNSTIKVTANDGKASTNVSFTATVNNSAPTGSLSDVTLTVGGGAQTIDLSSSFSDADGDSLSYAVSSSNHSHVTASVSGSTLTLTPVAKGGTSKIHVSADDGNFAWAPQFTATVNNSRPQGSLSNVSLTVGGSAQTIDLSSSFSDPDGDSLTFSAGSSNTKYVTASVSGSTLTLTPVAEGTSTISITADDGEVGWVPPHFTATVSPPVNNAPTGSISTVTLTVAGGAQTVDLSSSFSDADGDTLSFTASSSNTTYATVSVSGSTLTITPVARGAADISVTANDGTTSTTVSFLASIGSSPPTGSISAATLTEGGSAQTVDLSSSFSDPDNDVLSFTASSSQTSFVTVSVSGSTLTITPVAVGSSSISVTADDNTGLTTTVSFTATVSEGAPEDDTGSNPDPQPPEVVTNPNAPSKEPANRPPQAVGTIADIALAVGDSQSVQAQFSDPDGDTLSYSVAGGNNAVTVSLSGNTVTITAVAEGSATVAVIAADSHGASTTQLIDVTVVQPSEARLSTARLLLKVSGDNQSARIHTTLPNPLVVEVRDEQERVVEGVTVQFELGENGLALDSTPTTDANGQASATIRFGDTPGEFAVEVSVDGIDEPVVFTATAITSSGDVVYIDALEAAPNPDDLTMNRVYGVAYSPDGKTLASAHGDRSVRMWDVETRELKRTLGGSLTATSLERRGHKYAVRSVAFSPDGNILASGGRGGRMLLWDAGTGRLKQFVLRHAGAVWSLAFSPDSNTLAAATEGGYVYIYDVSNPQRVERKHRLRAHSVRAWSVAFSPDGRFLASGGGDTVIRLWDYETGSIKKVLQGHEEQVLSVAFGSDNTLASSSADGTVRMWDVETKSSRILDGHTDWVFSVAFHPNGDILASTGKDMSVRLWDTTSGVPLNVLERHTRWGRDVAISRDGILASAGYDNLIHLWDLGVRSDDAVENDEGGGTAQRQTTVQLLPNYPNPFNPETWIPYRLETASDVSLSIYDVSGRLVRTIDVGYQPARRYTNRSDAIYWDGRNTHGEHVASGVYVYRLTAGDYSASRRMVIVK